MKNGFAVRTLSCVIAVSAALGVVSFAGNKTYASDLIPINSVNFPNPNFRSFVSRFDTSEPKDNCLSPDEIAAVTTMNVSKQSVSDLTGIKLFSSLQSLDCSNNQLNTLDLSMCTTLRYLKCETSQLKKLILTGCQDLETVELDNNYLETLDLGDSPALKRILCNSNSLKSLNVKECSFLTDLFLFENQLESIDVSANKHLALLDLGSNKLSKLDITKNRALVELWVDGNPLEQVDISSCKDIIKLYKNTTPKTLDQPGGNTSYKYLWYENGAYKFAVNPDTKIFIGNNVQETFPDENFRKFIKDNFDKDNNGVLSSYELSEVTDLDLANKGITDLTGIELFKNLENLNVKNNDLKSLDLSNNPTLKKLDCAGCNLESLDISALKNLEILDCRDNNLKTLDVSKNKDLKAIVCLDNKIEKLDVTQNSKLEFLSCKNNDLSAIDVSNNSTLKYFDCSDNNLTRLNVKDNPELLQLECSGNKLTGIDVSKNEKLQSLYIAGNKLDSLDLTSNPDLIALACNGNDIDKVYVCTKITDVVKDDNTKIVIVTKADWKYEGTVWNGDEDKGFEAAAFYSCTVAGEEDYKMYTTMSVTRNLTLPTCEKAGTTIYNAVISAKDSLDGKDHKESKSVSIPAIGHAWGDWTILAEATADKEGSKKHTCFICGKTETFKTAKLVTPGSQTLKDPVTKPSDKSSGTKATVKDIKVSLTLDKSASLICGKSKTLKATLRESDSKISWKSSNTKIATVDSSGKVTGKMAGTVTITASAAGKTAKCKVTVLYKDVTNTKDFWFVPTNTLTAEGVVKGYDNQTKFKPANECTRAQMVTFIWRLMGEPAPKSTVCKFSDVKKSDYFYKACLWGNENHIVEGYKNGTFGPKIVCARRHAVTFLWRLAGSPKPSSSANRFSDVKKSDYFYNATLWASEKSILAGYSDGTFRPDGECLRRQMVTFLYKFEKVQGKK